MLQRSAIGLTPNADLRAEHDDPVSGVESEQVREQLQRLDRQQTWLWSTTIAVILLLTVGVASFAFPALLGREESAYSLNQSVRALVALVLIFSLYLVYQHTRIKRLHGQVVDQIQSLAKVESLASEGYKLAALDQLTGLYNRRFGEQRLKQEISRARRHIRPLTILLIDVNGLKHINDQHGHAAGDVLLRGFADRLQHAVRDSDVAVRLGGDEFMVLLPECQAEAVRHILARLEGLEIEFNDQRIRVQFSHGSTDYVPGETSQEMVQRADAALYENKRSGKRPSVVTQPSPMSQSLA
ncbi:MAG: GGDEF domain-containing protein [Candidatus Acidiferrales bacterium]